MVETTDEWITERTGIKERRILEDEFCTSDLGARAAQEACRRAGVSPAELDAIIVGTVSPDMGMPATAVFVQQKIGAKHCPAFDISAACSGFLYGMVIADSFIKSGLYRKVLVVGVEIVSRVLNWQDRGTCVLFGDGAGAAVFVPSEDGSGVIATEIHTDGSQACNLAIPGGGTVNPTNHDTVEKKLHFITMDGKKLFPHAVRNMASSSLAVMERCGVTAEMIKVVIAHQANLRILNAVSERTHIPLDKFFINIQRYGNTSSASVPIAFSEAVEDGTIQSGDLVLMTAFGAGVSWGSALVRW